MIHLASIQVNQLAVHSSENVRSGPFKSQFIISLRLKRIVRRGVIQTAPTREIHLSRSLDLHRAEAYRGIKCHD
jgi:hypothetical protein